MRRLVRAAAVVGLAAGLTLSGCDRRLDGHASIGPRADQAYFFAGDVNVFGQTVSANDKTELAYLRALRRIDVCGLLSRDVLAKVGEVVSVATLFAFNECDVDFKVPGASSRKLVTVELVMTTDPGDVVAFRIGDTAVYQDYAGGCQYLVPLKLESLPGARPLHKPRQPFARIGLIGQEDCGTMQRIATAIAQRLATGPLPPRDGAAVYPAPLAERDPCEVLGVIGAEIDHWDIDMTQPHLCQFSIWHMGLSGAQSVRVQLEPQMVESASGGRDRIERDGVEIYLDRSLCTAVSFVGPAMQRRMIGGGFIDTTNVVVRPAVVVESGSGDCDVVTDIAVRAVKLYV